MCGLMYQRGSLTPWVPNGIQQLNDIGAAAQILQNLDFSLNLALAHRFEALNNHFILRRYPPPLKNLAVFPSTHL